KIVSLVLISVLFMRETRGSYKIKCHQQRSNKDATPKYVRQGKKKRLCIARFEDYAKAQKNKQNGCGDNDSPGGK
ncbi:MAG: hypothetical protein RIE59_13460, partial [Imperialibacter sp.]